MEYKQTAVLRKGTLWTIQSLNEELLKHSVVLANYITESEVNLLPACLKLLFCPKTFSGYISCVGQMPVLHNKKYDVIGINFKVSDRHVCTLQHDNKELDVYIAFNTAEAKAMYPGLLNINTPKLVIKNGNRYVYGVSIDTWNISMLRNIPCEVISLLKAMLASKNKTFIEMCVNTNEHLVQLKRKYVLEKEYVIYQNITFNSFDNLCLVLPKRFNSKSYDIEYKYKPDHTDVYFGEYKNNRVKKCNNCI